MSKFVRIPETAFDELQLDAGVLLKAFDIETASFENSDIVCATTGGVNASCIPTYSDFAEDVDNAPNNLMEFKHLDGWECKLSTTSLGTSAESIRLSLGAADIVDNKIIPRDKILLTDYRDLWLVGGKANGGMLAIRLINALSTGGFSLQTQKKGKGQTALEFTGHVSIKAQDIVPMEFYSTDGTTESEPSGEQ